MDDPAGSRIPCPKATADSQLAASGDLSSIVTEGQASLTFLRAGCGGKEVDRVSAVTHFNKRSEHLGRDE